MNRRTLIQATGVAALLAAAGCALAAGSPSSTPAPLPSDSVYQLATPLTDQSARQFRLGDGRGTPTIVSMFYTSCQFVCPMLVEAIQSTLHKLPEGERQRVNVLLVTFDPEHDSVAVLKKTAQERQLDGARWTLARTDAANVRKLASVLGVQYKAIGNGDFNHSTALILLDAEGRVAARTSRLGDADAAFVKAIRTSLASTLH